MNTCPHKVGIEGIFVGRGWDVPQTPTPTPLSKLIMNLSIQDTNIVDLILNQITHANHLVLILLAHIPFSDKNNALH